jgi:hypothetical protein
MSTLNSFEPLRRVGTLALLTLVACALTALGQENNFVQGDRDALMPEYIQEFFMSDAVRSQEKGELQVTLASDSRRRMGSNAELELEYGLTNRLQISAELPYGITPGNEEGEDLPGWSSIRIGTLYQIIRSDRPFALSVGIMAEVPVRPGDELGIQPTILVAKSFRRLQIHASALADITEGRPELEYNLASVYPVKRRWFPTLEFNGRRAGAMNSFYVTPGLYRHLRHRVEIGIGSPLGAGGIASRAGVVAVMSWEFGGDER